MSEQNQDSASPAEDQFGEPDDDYSSHPMSDAAKVNIDGRDYVPYAVAQSLEDMSNADERYDTAIQMMSVYVAFYEAWDRHYGPNRPDDAEVLAQSAIRFQSAKNAVADVKRTVKAARKTIVTLSDLAEPLDS